MKALRRLRSLFRKKTVDAEMAAEMQAHLELQAVENEKRGMSREEARYAARRSFGGMEQIKERVRDQRGWAWLEHGIADLYYAGRMLGKHPGFTCATVLVLAIGIGACTGVFAVIDRAIFRRLPVSQPEQLVIVAKAPARGGRIDTTFSYPAYERLRSAGSLAGLVAFASQPRTLVPPKGEAELSYPQFVSGNFFSAMGVRPVLGRLLNEQDDRPGDSRPVVVLGHAFWQKLGGDPRVVGKTLLLDQEAFEIVGVAPREFTGLSVGGNVDLWVPLQTIPRLDAGRWGRPLSDENLGWLQLMGRLRPGVAREQAGAELATIHRGTAPASMSSGPRTADGAIELRPGAAGFNPGIDRSRSTLLVAAAVVGMVLLVACANVAGLVFARTAARRRELAVRAALGASRWRLIQQLLIETLVLAVAGGVLGIVFAQWAMPVLVDHLVPGAVFGFRPDGRTLAFVALTTMAAGLLAGLAPALSLSSISLAPALKDQTSAVTGGGSQRVNRALVVGQIAVSVCLLVVAGLFVRTLQNLQASDLGYERENLFLFRVELDNTARADRRVSFVREAMPRLTALPGVRGATIVEALRPGTSSEQRIQIEGYSALAGEDMAVHRVSAGPGFFEVLGLRLLHGRGFSEAETQPAISDPKSAGRPIVVSESLARKYFNGADPIGRRIVLLGNGATAGGEVVGVARDVRITGLRGEGRPVIYVPAEADSRRVSFAVRSTARAGGVVASIRSLVHELEPHARVGEVRKIEDDMNSLLGSERTLADTTGFFSVLALLLSSLGLYGLLSYQVVQRTREMGIRVALGASRAEIFGLVVRRGVGLAMLGLGLGVASALGLAQFAGSLIYGVSAADPTTLAATVALMGVTALFACWLPARRAMKVDPLVALRAE